MERTAWPYRLISSRFPTVTHDWFFGWYSSTWHGKENYIEFSINGKYTNTVSYAGPYGCNYYLIRNLRPFGAHGHLTWPWPEAVQKYVFASKTLQRGRGGGGVPWVWQRSSSKRTRTGTGSLVKNMTRFQLILPVVSQNVKKNLTGHRMHVAGPQIYHINRHTNSFQNMYGIL